MEQTRTQTNTPPAEAVGLHQEARKSSIASSEPKTSSETSTSASVVTSGHENAKSLPEQEDVAMADYVGDVRSTAEHGTITPSQVHSHSETQINSESQPLSQTHDSSGCQTVATSPDSCNSSMFHSNVEHDSSAIFKPFDSKTGQFVGQTTDRQATKAEAAEPPLSTQSEDFRTLASLKAAAARNNKFRSHSVPSILHSSLRRIGLSTTCGFLTSQQQQPVVHVNRGVNKKKKQNKHSSSLRHALLMNQRLQPLDGQMSLSERVKYIRAHTGPVPLPPINVQCLKEIDLQEIVKNPQLRHDIIFDPLLQFRPNLDGERGLKKKQISDKYWNDVENEIYVYTKKPDAFRYEETRLVPLFNSLKEVLVTIVPQKEVHTVQNVLDTELLVQELLKGSLMMSNFSDWLAQLFKHHCAPMRDPWVDKMSQKFKESEEEKSITKLVEGLRLVFQILEAMKLDIANHQIRILRPALLSNAVEFEKQYFQSLMASNRVDLKSSFKWFNEKYSENYKNELSKSSRLSAPDVYRLCIRSIIGLLSCRKMVREYPTSLSFDHARLILLRADIRQIVCLLVCRLLFKQLVANDSTMDKRTKEYVITSYANKKLKEEIVSIITDEHGNCRWTKNTMSIAVHLCKTIRDLKQEFQLQRNLGDVSLGSSSTSNDGTSVASAPLDTLQIDFAKSWLSKQTQPLSEVYGVLENRVFKSLEESIFERSSCTQDGSVKQDFIHICSAMSSAGTSATTGSSVAHSGAIIKPTINVSPRKDNILKEQRAATPQAKKLASLDVEEFESLFCHLYTLVNFHWSVFGCLYMECLGDKMEEIL